MDDVRLMGFVQRSPVLAEGSSLPTMLAIHEECGEMWACRRAELGKGREIFPVTVDNFNCGKSRRWRAPLQKVRVRPRDRLKIELQWSWNHRIIKVEKDLQDAWVQPLTWYHNAHHAFRGNFRREEQTWRGCTSLNATYQNKTTNGFWPECAMSMTILFYNNDNNTCRE